MKKIFLIGDSIRMGYDKYVKDALRGIADVFYPEENCRFAEYVLRYIHDWKKQLELADDVDLVHFNAGLWDCLEIFGDEPLTSLDYYGEAIFRIYKRLRMLFPRAKIVFATSTAVIENKTLDHVLLNATIEKYNERAKEVLADTEAIINDLYSITSKLPEHYHSDATHYYTPEATALIGGRVLALICRELGIEASEVDIKFFEPNK